MSLDWKRFAVDGSTEHRTVDVMGSNIVNGVSFSFTISRFGKVYQLDGRNPLTGRVESIAQSATVVGCKAIAELTVSEWRRVAAILRIPACEKAGYAAGAAFARAVKLENARGIVADVAISSFRAFSAWNNTGRPEYVAAFTAGYRETLRSFTAARDAEQFGPVAPASVDTALAEAIADVRVNLHRAIAAGEYQNAAEVADTVADWLADIMLNRGYNLNAPDVEAAWKNCISDVMAQLPEIRAQADAHVSAWISEEIEFQEFWREITAKAAEVEEFEMLRSIGRIQRDRRAKLVVAKLHPHSLRNPDNFHAAVEAERTGKYIILLSSARYRRDARMYRGYNPASHADARAGILAHIIAEQDNAGRLSRREWIEQGRRRKAMARRLAGILKDGRDMAGRREEKARALAAKDHAPRALISKLATPAFPEDFR